MVGRWVLAAAGGVGIGVALLAVAPTAAAPRRPERFVLSPELEARVAAHGVLVANAGRSTEDFCKLATDTIELLDPILRELSRFEGDQHHSPPFSAIEDAYASTEKRVRGVYLVAFEEGYRTGIDYPKLAKLAPQDARPVLRAIDKFERGDEGIASWAVLVTDYSACHAPEKARAPLATLARTWSAAPSCLRDALRERLNHDLEDMVARNCFCDQREPALAAVRKNVRLLRSLADTRGPELADKFLETTLSPDVRFACSPR